MAEVKDNEGHLIDIPDKELREIERMCGMCYVPKQYKKLFNMDISFLNCPYDCVNDIEHYKFKHKERVMYK